MDVSNLKDHAIWLSIVIAYLIPKISPYVDRCISKIWTLLTNHFPKIIKKVIRNRMAKKLRVIRKKRWRTVYINYEISRANSWFIAFLGLIGVYLILFTLGPFKEVFEMNFVLGLLFASPIYIIELVWLVHDSKVKQLLYYHSKIRITRL